MNPPNSLDSFNITIKAAAIRAIRAIRSPTWECMKSGINDTNAKKNLAAISASWLWLLIPRCHRRRYRDIMGYWYWEYNGILHDIMCMYVYIYIYIHITYIYIYLVGGWPTPLKNMKVSWDYDIPNIWKVIKVMFQTTNQIYYNTVDINIHSNTSWMLCTTAGRALNCSQILDPTMVAKSCHDRW